MGIQTDILRTIIECRGAETTAQKFGMLGNAASETEKKLRSMADRAGAISLVAGGIGTGMLAAAGGLLKVAGAAEQAQIAFTTLLKSPQEAKKHLAELASFAAKTPFEFTGLRTLSTQLLAYGFNVKSVIPMLRSLGDAGSALGQGPEGLSRIIRAIGQMHNKGRVQMQELLQLSEAGVPVFQILQSELGLTAEQVGEIGRQGVSAKDGIAALLRGMDKLYGGGMASQAKTLVGVMSNLSDQFALLGMELGETLIPAATAGANIIEDLAEQLRDASPSVKRAIAAFILFGGVSMILVSVGARVTHLVLLWKLAAAQKATASAKAVAAEKTEQSAVNATTLAYERKFALNQRSGAMRAFGMSAGMDVMARGQKTWFDRPSLLSRGRFEGGAGQAQQAIGLGMASLRIGQVLTDASMEADEKLGKLGAAAGYLAGAFSPVILGATMAGEALAALADAAGDYLLARHARNVAEVPGLTASGEKITDEKALYQQYLNMMMRGVKGGGIASDMSFQTFQTLAARSQKGVDRKAAFDAMAAAATATQTAQSGWLSGLRGKAEEAAGATDVAKARQAYAEAAKSRIDLSGKTAAALRAEAAAQYQLWQALLGATETETDEAKRKGLRADATKAYVASVKLNTEAMQTERDAADKAAKAQDELADKRAKSAKAAKEAAFGGAEAAVGYFKAVGDPVGGAQTLRLLGLMYDKEAQVAAQANDVEGAFKAKTAAVSAYTEALNLQNSSLTKSLSIGNAYATYLDTIGNEQGANAYRKGTLAGQAASLAQAAFIRGDVLSGWQAATEAERLARAGTDAKTGGLGFSTGGSVTGALTGAVPGYMAAAAGRSATQVNLRQSIVVRDEAGTTRARMRREDRQRVYQAR